MAKRHGFVARALDGRLDRSIVGDLGVLAGAVLFGIGLWQLSQPVAWLFAGATIAGGSVLAMLPQKKPSGTPRGDA